MVMEITIIRESKVSFMNVEGKSTSQVERAFSRARSEAQYHAASIELRKEALSIADSYVGNPLRFSISNGIEMDVEITKSDVKTIVGKRTHDAKFNAIKNALARDLKGYLKKAKYEGWREVIPNKHPETVYFAYYSRTLGAKTYLCVRKMGNTGLFKPYAIIDQRTFDAEIGALRKDKPPR